MDIPYLRPSLSHIYVILLFFSQMSVTGCRSIMCQKCSTSHQDVNEFGRTGSRFQLFLVSLFNFFQDERSRCSFLNGLWGEFFRWQPQHPHPLNLSVCFLYPFLNENESSCALLPRLSCRGRAEVRWGRELVRWNLRTMPKDTHSHPLIRIYQGLKLWSCHGIKN